MLYREIIAVCSQIHTKHKNTVCGQNVELLNVKLVVHIVTTGLVKVKSLANRRIFRTWPERPWGPPSLLYNGYRIFSRGKERPGRDANPPHPSSAMVMKG